MNYTQCLDSLASLGHELRGVKFSLDPVRTILETLGHPESRYPTAIVAGTNGKGSASAMLASILESAGYRTGLYSSPHLVRVNERMRINGEEIPDDDFACAFTEVWECVGRLLDSRALASRPSFFEYLTATAFVHFARAGVDFAVLEVGLGGRLDATNVTESHVAVITNIALDHQEILGSTIAAIAGEKAGVIQAGRPVVSSCEDTEAREVIQRRAAELGAPLIETAASAQLSIRPSRGGTYEFDLALDGDFFPGLVSPLMGRFQVKNAVAAVAAAQELGRQGWEIYPAAIRDGLAGARWPGRLEIVAEHPLVVLDGAHNPAAARVVADFAREQWHSKRLRLIYASMRDKAIGEIGALLFPLAQKIYLTRPDQARAATPEEILAASHALPREVALEPEPAKALEIALRESGPDDVILAAGSLFLVGEIKQALPSLLRDNIRLAVQAALEGH
jgi:dihydrofolate synthase/folylpolyglutamate synthase